MPKPDIGCETTNVVEAALHYAECGLLVFPVPPGSKRSYKSAQYCGGRRWGATRDPDEIEWDWSRWPYANVGIATGDDSGVFVVEIDTLAGHGVDGFAALHKLPALPLTLTAQSPSGSRHYYFRYPTTCDIRNSANVLGPGIDVRGEGGMVVAPPSIRKDGAYIWLNALLVAEAPEWLLDALTPAPAVLALPRNGSGTANPLLVAALYTIDPDIAEPNWFAIGCACLTEFGPELGFEIFDTWSSGGKKYKPREMQRQWENICRGRYRYSAGTIYHFAEMDWEEFDREQIAKMHEAAREANVEE
jgi:Bifunctional DNA primase/polymerase, N-terminal/Primase C terminal 2 (PriCT-2)